MSTEAAKKDGAAEWHYLAGVEARGPVSLDEIARLIAAETLPGSVMISSKDLGKWRPAAEVFSELQKQQQQAPATAQTSRTLLDHIGDTLHSVAGTQKLEGFSLAEMFSETFQKRSVAEMEEYMIVGTEKTTPKITEVHTGWPKPWLFLRFLLFFFVIYAAFVTVYEHFHNRNLIPGLIIIGASAMPLATLVLFFELNTPRNVSLYRLLVLVGLGGIASLTVSLFGFDMLHLDWLGASGAGIIEEIGKLVALVLIVRGKRYRYILNGLLFGAAVGAGFACFESAGYAYRYIADYGKSPMLSIIWVRALLAPFMHVAWTALVGAALWRVKGSNAITIETFLDPRFYRILLFTIILHMLWNSPFHPPFYFKELALGSAAWFVIWGLVQQGLRQVRDVQQAEAAESAVVEELKS